MDLGLAPAKSWVRAWDVPTRLFHWALVLLIFLSWASFRYSEALGDHLLKVHRWSGLAILILLVWRLMWGLFGSSTARFSSFVRGPMSSVGYLRDLVTGRERKFLGHNPAGALMVLALLAVVGAQACLGLFTVEHNDLTAGPLYRLLSEDAVKQISRWHRWAFYYVMVPLIVLHVVANVLYGLLKGEPLIAAMISGRKPALAYEDADAVDVPSRPLLLALFALGVAAAAILGGIVALGGRLP